MLPLNSDVVGHYFYLRKQLTETNPKFLKKIPHYKDLKDQLLRDVVGVWNKACLPVLSKQRIEAKLKELIEKYNAARKKEMKRGGSEVNEEWLQNLFDISACKCSIPENPVVRYKKLLCSCELENRIPEKEIAFLKDHRKGRKRYIGGVEASHVKNE